MGRRRSLRLENTLPVKTLFANLLIRSSLWRESASRSTLISRVDRRIHRERRPSPSTCNQQPFQTMGHSHPKPDGGALRSSDRSGCRGLPSRKPPERAASRGAVHRSSLAPFKSSFGGYDLAVVLKAYWEAAEEFDETLKTSP